MEDRDNPGKGGVRIVDLEEIQPGRVEIGRYDDGGGPGIRETLQILRTVGQGNRIGTGRLEGCRRFDPFVAIAANTTADNRCQIGQRCFSIHPDPSTVE
jgi:hypothetical protein